MDKAFFKQLDQQHLSADNRRHINMILDLLDNRYSEITASGNLSHYQDYAKLVTLDVSPKVYEILSYDIKVLSDSTASKIAKPVDFISVLLVNSDWYSDSNRTACSVFPLFR